MAEAKGSIKRCSRCWEWLHVTQYRQDNSRKDGLDPYCTNCRASYNRHKNPTKADLQRQLETAEAKLQWFLLNIPRLLNDPYTSGLDLLATIKAEYEEDMLTTTPPHWHQIVGKAHQAQASASKANDQDQNTKGKIRPSGIPEETYQRMMEEARQTLLDNNPPPPTQPKGSGEPSEDTLDSD